MNNFLHKYLWPGLLALVLTFTGCTGMLYLAQTANAETLKPYRVQKVERATEARQLAALRNLSKALGGYTVPTFYSEKERSEYKNKVKCLINWAQTLSDRRDRNAYMYWLDSYVSDLERSPVLTPEQVADRNARWAEVNKTLIPTPPAPCPRIKQ